MRSRARATSWRDASEGLELRVQMVATGEREEDFFPEKPKHSVSRVSRQKVFGAMMAVVVLVRLAVMMSSKPLAGGPPMATSSSARPGRLTDAQDQNVPADAHAGETAASSSDEERPRDGSGVPELSAWTHSLHPDVAASDVQYLGAAVTNGVKPKDRNGRGHPNGPAADEHADAGAGATSPPMEGVAAESGASSTTAPSPIQGQAGRQEEVKAAFLHAWKSYCDLAWGADEVDPVRRSAIHSFGMGLTLVDSLDTMLLMGLKPEFEQALQWVEASLRFGEQEEINVFEVTIRILGGLISAYEQSGAAVLLKAAEQLGTKLLFAFDTPTGLPYGTVGLRSGKRYNPTWSRGASTIAEVATIQLEFRALSRHTGNPAFEAVAQRVMSHFRKMRWPEALPRGLYPTFISPTSGEFTSNDVTLGARADSLYEYFLKQWLLSGKTDERIRAMYDDSVRAIVKHLVRYGGIRCDNCSYIGSWNYVTKQYTNNMDHLACFVPGMLALGLRADLYSESAAEQDQYLELAERIMETCYRMYADQPSGLAPEIATFRSHEAAVVADNHAKHNLLRPETIESLFILWRQTGNTRYREWGWTIFQAIQRHCKVDGGGYSGLKDVTTPRLGHTGKMESFFTAETLKYLWLLFSDGNLIPLEQYVFNTEAHPLRIHPDYRWGAEFGSVPDLDELDDLGESEEPEWLRLLRDPPIEELRRQAAVRARLLASKATLRPQVAIAAGPR